MGVNAPYALTPIALRFSLTLEYSPHYGTELDKSLTRLGRFFGCSY